MLSKKLSGLESRKGKLTKKEEEGVGGEGNHGQKWKLFWNEGRRMKVVLILSKSLQWCRKSEKALDLTVQGTMASGGSLAPHIPMRKGDLCSVWEPWCWGPASKDIPDHRLFHIHRWGKDSQLTPRPSFPLSKLPKPPVNLEGIPLSSCFPSSSV